MARTDSEKRYGLPILTMEEFRRFLGLSEDAFMHWVYTELKPTPTEFKHYFNPDVEKRRKMPEVLIRFYLSTHPFAAVAPESAVTERVHGPSRGPLQANTKTSKRKTG